MLSQLDINLTGWMRQEKWMLNFHMAVDTVSLNILVNNLTKYRLNRQKDESKTEQLGPEGCDQLQKVQLEASH